MIDTKFPIIVDAFGLTDVGIARKNNQDSFLVSNSSRTDGEADLAEAHPKIAANGSIFVVADGMGGLQAGEVASRMAVDLVAMHLAETLRAKEPANQQDFIKLLTAAVLEANRLVYEQSAQNSHYTGMGTTLTAAVTYGGSIFFAQVGDSRAYLLRNGSMKQMTTDQSLVAQLVASGSITPDEAKTHPRRNVILRALGVEPRVEVAISFAELKRDDRLVLCSDGLWGKVEPDEIRELIERFNPTSACESLVRLARDRGGEDNITVIVAFFSGEGLPVPDSEDIPRSSNVRAKSRWRFWAR